MAFTAPGLYSRVRTMLPEILKFLVVGGLGTVIDLGGAALLHSKYHFEPLAAKAVSVTLATLFTYLGSRFWTFRERENQSMRREAVLFFVLNVVGLLIAEAVIGLVTYVMGLRGSLEYNAASSSAPDSARSSGSTRTASGCSSTRRARPRRRHCPTPPRSPTTRRGSLTRRSSSRRRPSRHRSRRRRTHPPGHGTRGRLESGTRPVPRWAPRASRSAPLPAPALPAPPGR